MRAAEQVPASVADDNGPRVYLGLPFPAGLAAVPEQHAAPGRDGRDQRAGGGGIGPGQVPVGHGGRVLPQRGRLTADVLRQCSDDLAESRTNRVVGVGVGGGRLAVEHRHDQAESLGLGEDDRRQPRPAAEPVPAIGAPDRVHRDAGLAEDRDVAARGPFGDA